MCCKEGDSAMGGRPAETEWKETSKPTEKGKMRSKAEDRNKKKTRRTKKEEEAEEETGRGGSRGVVRKAVPQ